MIRVGITGQSGFIGTHLFNALGLLSNRFERIAFEDEYFQNEKQLLNFVKECDTIIHLAALNRHNDPEVIYQTNLSLVKQLINACEKTKSTPHILFSSSTQEERDNQYGKSKKEGRKLFKKWAINNKSHFTGIIIPNVFGPFGNPYYNSVVATFCHQLTHNKQPIVDNDQELKLIYIDELVTKIIEFIENIESRQIKLPHTIQITVSEILRLLEDYKKKYLENGEIPKLETKFKINLFNTFLTYIDLSSFFPFNLEPNTDKRGSFIETMKLNSGGLISFSTTVPGVTRGNHFHTRKAERFVIIKGKAKIELRRIGTDKVYSFIVDGKNPAFVDMPIWFTHNITNIGEEELFTIFWINEHFDNNDPDTYLEIV